MSMPAFGYTGPVTHNTSGGPISGWMGRPSIEGYQAASQKPGFLGYDKLDQPQYSAGYNPTGLTTGQLKAANGGMYASPVMGPAFPTGSTPSGGWGTPTAKKPAQQIIPDDTGRGPGGFMNPWEDPPRKLVGSTTPSQSQQFMPGEWGPFGGAGTSQKYPPTGPRPQPSGPSPSPNPTGEKPKVITGPEDKRKKWNEVAMMQKEQLRKMQEDSIRETNARREQIINQNRQQEMFKKLLGPDPYYYSRPGMQHYSPNPVGQSQMQGNYANLPPVQWPNPVNTGYGFGPTLPFTALPNSYQVNPLQAIQIMGTTGRRLEPGEMPQTSYTGHPTGAMRGFNLSGGMPGFNL